MKLIETFGWIAQFESSRKWSDSIESEKTKRLYFSYFRKYCEETGKTPDQLIEMKMEGLKNVATNREWQCEDLLQDYLTRTQLSESAKVSLKTAVLSFYAANRRHLQPDAAKNVRSPTPKKRSPKFDDLLKLEGAMTTQRDKSLLWLLALCALRSDTALNLQRKMKP